MTNAKAVLRAARKALEDNSRREQAAGIDWETPEYLALNHAVIEAEQGVRWWRDSLSEIRDRFRTRT